MPHSRILAPVRSTSEHALIADWVGIGMLVGRDPSPNPNIEDALLFASIEGLERGDLRVLAVLVTWFGLHSGRVNADRLIRIVALEKSARVHAFWSALATWRGADRRFARLAKGYPGERIDLLSAGTAFQLARHGEDLRFEGSRLRVPANALRDRSADVLTSAELASRHPAYRWRLVIGPTVRADMWAALERDPKLTAAQLARVTYGAFATAWQVRRDFATWKSSGVAGSVRSRAPNRGS